MAGVTVPEDWRATTLAAVRRLIMAADPDMTEVVKWRKPTNPEGVPVWEHGGIVCTGETYKAHVKLTFPHGAALPDPDGLFTPATGGTRRAIDLREGDRIDEAAFTTLIRAAVARNLSSGSGSARNPGKR